MPGPPPKSPATRQRRNRSSTATTLVVSGDKARAPALPSERDWHPQTKAWWEDVFHSPMAGEFVRADIHGLIRLALLVDDYWQAETPTARKDLAGEIRLQAQGYGLSPLDRRRLQWTVERAEQATKGKRSKRRAKDDPRLRLAS